MATKDYVKRGKTPRPTVRNNNKSSKSYKKPEPPTRSAFPAQLAATAIALTMLLIAGLSFLVITKDSAPQSDTAPTPTTTTTTANVSPIPTTTSVKSLPPIPEEKWSYIKTLENKEIEITVNEQEISTRPYLMQCGAYRSASQADERKVMIAFQGLSSDVRATVTENGTWYRVILGPYKSKRKAEQDRNALRRAGIDPCAIWFWE